MTSETAVASGALLGPTTSPKHPGKCQTDLSLVQQEPGTHQTVRDDHFFKVLQKLINIPSLSVHWAWL